MRSGLLLAASLILAPASPAQEAETGPDTLTVVELVVDADVSEDPPPPNPFAPAAPNVRAQLQHIRSLATDPEVDAVRLLVEGTPDFARSLDLLDALAVLKASDKPIVCYAETLSRNDLMISSLADLLAVPPTGMIALEGLTIEALYMRDLLARVDASVEVLHVGDFKTAYEELARDSMSDGQRRMLEDILDEYWMQTLETIAGHRGIPTAAVEELFARVLVEPAVAAEAGLLDAVLYEDAFDARVEELLGGPVTYVENYGDERREQLEKMLESPFAMFSVLPMLLDPPEREAPDEPYVAVVYATGTIVSGESQVDFQGNVTAMGSDTMVAALDRVAEDENCRAVVLRVNSPGGSALASDMIWRAVERVQESKPVVASMGRLAASGGYWISMGCRAIVAQPSTLTGSIGVVSMLPDLSRTLDLAGINVEVVARGPLGDQLALLEHGPTPALEAVLTRWMDDTYRRFLEKVSAGRGLPVERVAELAKGRVWTGRQAEEIGLVDELGGLEDAIDLACVMGGLDREVAPMLELPDLPSFLDQLEEEMGGAARLSLGPAGDLVRALGFGRLVDLAAAACDPSPLGPDRVQAVLPVEFVVR